MILSDKTIKEYLDNGNLIITPEPDDIQVQPASVDLRLDDEFLYFDNSFPSCINTRNLGSEQKYHVKNTFSDDSPLVLYPNKFVLAQTVEWVELPDFILGRVEGRSSLGRLGIAVHITAGFIDPGFKGNITLEMCNFSNLPVALYPNQRICQIVFEELDQSCEKPYGVGSRNKYMGQTHPTASRIYDDIG